MNNKAPTLKLLFSTYLSWLTHKSPVRRQPAIQLIDSVRWFVGSDVFLSASFLFNLPIWKQLEIEDTSYSVESVGQGVYDATRRGFAIRLFVSQWWAKTRRRKIPFCKYTNCALGWSGVTTDVLFNGFYGVVSCNCKTRKLCSMILRRILRNWFGGIFYIIFFWNQEKISEKGTKGEFCRKLQDCLKKCCVLSQQWYQRLRWLKKRVLLWSVTISCNVRSTTEFWPSFQAEPDWVILCSWQRIFDYVIIWFACLTCLRAENLIMRKSAGIYNLDHFTAVC